MDLNQLLFHHQIALIRYAFASFGGGDHGSRFDLVRHYERRIARLRGELGVTTYPTWA